MKNYDKNSLTGFVLMFLILLIFNFYFLPTNEKISEQKEEIKTENNISEPKSINTDKIELTSDEKEKKYGVFSNSAESEFNEYVIENDKIKVVVSNKGGTKTARILESESNVVTILQVTGGAWNNSDLWTNTISNSAADANELLKSNRTFLAHQAYYAFVVGQGSNPSGAGPDVRSRLELFVDAIGANVRSGGNDKVHAYTSDVIGGTAITGVAAEDKLLIDLLKADALKVVKNETVTPATGNNESQVIDNTITQDPGFCATQTAAVQTLCDLASASILAGSMQTGSNDDGYRSITTAAGIPNQESTLFFLSSHNTVKDMVFEGMSGFVPYGPDDKNTDHGLSLIHI